MARAFAIRDEVLVHAPLERCFLLSTSVELVRRELHMTPRAGRTAGLVTGGDNVLWKGWQLGLPQFHHSLIEAYRPCTFFRDRMIAGRFRAFEHDHAFDLQEDGSVRMHDEVRFTMRWGILGDLIGAYVLAPHIRRLLRRRFALLKGIVESEEWRMYLKDEQAELPSHHIQR